MIKAVNNENSWVTSVFSCDINISTLWYPNTHLLAVLVFLLVVLDDVAAGEKFVIGIMEVPQGVVRSQEQDFQL